MNWPKGISGNPLGRPRGSHDKQPRRQRKLDTAEAAEWSPKQWRRYYEQALGQASGIPGERERCAVGACAQIWLETNQDNYPAGRCASCATVFRPEQSVQFQFAPMKIAEGTWVHANCADKFHYNRWQSAIQAITGRLGLKITL